jgi:hypothetical protein
VPDSRDFNERLEEGRLTQPEQNWNMPFVFSCASFAPEKPMPVHRQPDHADDDGLEAAVNQAIAACGGDLRSAIRALIVANDFLENEVSELMKAVSHAYVRGRFNTYSG